MKQQKKYFISPYNFSLVCVFLALLAIGEGIIVWLALSHPNQGGLAGVYFCTGCLLITLAVLLYNGYEYFGIMKILSDKLVFYAPLHKPRVFYFSEICDIGIDYGTVSGRKHFYIFFGKAKIAHNLTHNITRLRFSNVTMRIQYRRNLYDALVEALSQDALGKQLSKNESVIRLFHLDGN